MMFNLNSIMSTDVVTVPLSASLAEARSLMRENRFHHLPVVNDGGDFVGLLTQTDVLAATDSILRDAENRVRARNIPIVDVLVRNVVTISENASVRRAALFLEKYRIGCLPVVTKGKLVGIITDTDFVAVAINLLEQLEEFEPVEEENT
jgi:CBS domain-containing membrane protein